MQIAVSKDFGQDDDSVIEKLRDNMHDLKSHRLDHPGKSPAEELPEKPFGLVNFPETEVVEYLPEDKNPKEWTIEKEAGLRKGEIYFFIL